MKMIDNPDIWAFLGKNNITVEICDRGTDWFKDRFYCVFYHKYANSSANIKDGCTLLGLYGNGNSPSEAFEDCFRKYSGKVAVFPSEKNRAEIQFPIIL